MILPSWWWCRTFRGASSSFPGRVRGSAASPDVAALCLGFGRDWAVMGGRCWGALCCPGGLVWWVGIGFICSVYRFVFASPTPHSRFEPDSVFFLFFLTSSEKRNSIERHLIPSAPALDTCTCFDQSCEEDSCSCPTKKGGEEKSKKKIKKRYYSRDEMLLWRETCLRFVLWLFPGIKTVINLFLSLSCTKRKSCRNENILLDSVSKHR